MTIGKIQAGRVNSAKALKIVSLHKLRGK